jgi:raffinose/stachyose/melibiose transport system substrate-binding protein
MTRRSKLWGLGLGLAAVCGLLLGCGTGQNHTAEPTEPTATAQAATAQTHEPLTICAGLVDFPALQEALAQVYPEVVLEPVSYKGGNTSGYLQLELENGDIPDLYVDTYFRSGTLQKENLVDLSGYDFVNCFTESMLSQLDVDGSIYMIPSSYQVQGIYYNKTMFAAHGWAVPQSFEELKALVATIREEGAAQGITPVRANLRLAGHPFTYFFSLNNTGFFGTPAGSKWKTDFLEGTVTAAGYLEEPMAYFQQWIDAGILQAQDVGSREGLDEFMAGNVAMVLNLNISWDYEQADGSTMEVGIIPWLSEDGSNNMLTITVNRLFGIRKALEEPGNEQKLADALKVMEFLSSLEGQELLAGTTEGILPLKNTVIDADSPLHEVQGLIDGGYTVPLVYIGWVDHLLYPLSEGLNQMISGTMTGNEVIAALDEVNAQLQADPHSDAITYVAQALSQEQAARLSGMAMLDYAGADAALVSLGDYIDDLQNRYGVNAGVYPGYMTQEQINIFCPWNTDTVTMTFTGAELEALAELGANIEGAGAYFPYVLTVRNDAALEPEQTYTVVFSLADYDPVYDQRIDQALGVSAADILAEYLARYDQVDESVLSWE